MSSVQSVTYVSGMDIEINGDREGIRTLDLLIKSLFTIYFYGVLCYNMKCANFLLNNNFLCI